MEQSENPEAPTEGGVTPPTTPVGTGGFPAAAPTPLPLSVEGAFVIDVNPDRRITEYIYEIRGRRPDRLVLVGVGRDVGRAAWLALVLERDHKFQQVDLALDRVMGPNGLDVGRLTVVLERVKPTWPPAPGQRRPY